MDEGHKTAAGYRRHAAKLRETAHGIYNDETRRGVLAIAENYEQLATSIERITSHPQK